MTHRTWQAVDDYFNGLLLPPDEALETALKASDTAGLPAIQVTASHGKFLHLLARLMGARKILEIGTLGGYSTIWLARALPADGRLITLEIDPKHAEVARANLAHAGLSGIAEVRVGKAIETLPRLVNEAPFDLIFIDADKPSNTDYFQWALKLARPGTLIVVDNVVRNGAVADAASTDPNVHGVRRLAEFLAAEPRVTCTVLQTVGSKAYDGLLLALVVA